jgi:hypothetical protein
MSEKNISPPSQSFGGASKIALFEGQKIRRHWDEKKKLWYFSIVDVIAVLTNSDNPQVYWHVLKKMLIGEGSNGTVTKNVTLSFKKN